MNSLHVIRKQYSLLPERGREKGKERESGIRERSMHVREKGERGRGKKVRGEMEKGRGRRGERERRREEEKERGREGDLLAEERRT
jgi:hypothetical protein